MWLQSTVKPFQLPRQFQKRCITSRQPNAAPRKNHPRSCLVRTAKRFSLRRSCCRDTSRGCTPPQIMHLKKKSLVEFATKHSKVRNPYGIMSITTTRPRPAKYVIKNFQAPIYSIIIGNTYTMFENHQKMSHLELWHFLSIYVLSGNTVLPQARFARNVVKRDFFCDF